MAQTRSITDQAIDRGVAPYGGTNFSIANILTTVGLKQLDIYAALLARVTTWEFSFDGGSISNSDAGFFSASTTVSGAIEIPIDYGSTPPIATEKVFSFGLELYAIREDRNGSGLSGAVTALTITFPPDAFSGSLPEIQTNYSGPKVDTLTTQIVSATVQTAACEFFVEFVITCLAVDGAITRTTFFKVSTSNVGHNTGTGGVTSPYNCGDLTIEIPDWKSPGEFVTITVPLYADSLGPEDTVWATTTSFTYSGQNISGSLNITMRPSTCWPYENSQSVRTWNDDGTLAISIQQLYNGEP